MNEDRGTALRASEATVRRIEHKGQLLAIIIPAGCRTTGVTFLTDNDSPLQVGMMHRQTAWIIPPHLHINEPRTVEKTQEALFIREGRLRVDIYDEIGVYLESHVLAAGDIILLAGGGHGFEVLEEADFLEIKTGPYVEGRDKRHIVPAAKR